MEWRQVFIDGVPYDYEVSNTGMIRNMITKKTLKLREDKDGYLTVIVYKNKKQKALKVHRAVATAFLENDDEITKTEVNHINRIKTDNRVENLEWCSRGNNMRHSHAKKVQCIETGEMYNGTRDAERKTGVQHGDISSCCRGKKKTAGGFHWQYI